MLKILQARFQQYTNHEFPDVQPGFGKGRGTRDQTANICCIIKKRKRVPGKHLFLLYIKTFDYVYHNKLWKILHETAITNHLTCLLRNLYADQAGTIRAGHGTDWFQIGKELSKGYILSPCLFNLYAEYIMQNVWLDEAQPGIQIAGRNMNKLRYADDSHLMVESKEELKSLLIKVQEESEKVGLKCNIHKTKIMASSPITSWQIDGKQWKQRLYFWGLQNHCRW